MFLIRRGLMAALAAGLFTVPAVGEEDVRYYEENGVTYRETRRTVHRPVTQTEYVERDRIVYRPETRAESRDIYRTYQVPVTEYRWEAQLRGRFNPFVRPYWVNEYVPRTFVETRSEVVKEPYLRQELVAETRTERVPIVSQRLVEEQITSRVAVSGGGAPIRVAPESSNGAIVSSQRLGGVGEVKSDPPRYGENTAWRSSGAAIRR
jgi:hypothetical protein